jgi:hypothetical protein
MARRQAEMAACDPEELEGLGGKMVAQAIE